MHPLAQAYIKKLLVVLSSEESILLCLAMAMPICPGTSPVAAVAPVFSYGDFVQVSSSVEAYNSPAVWKYVRSELQMGEQKLVLCSTGDKGGRSEDPYAEPEHFIRIAAHKVSLVEKAPGALTDTNCSKRHSTEAQQTNNEGRGADAWALAMLELNAHETGQLTFGDQLVRADYSFQDKMNVWHEHMFGPTDTAKVDLSYFCNKEIPIPGWGDNRVMFTQMTECEVCDLGNYPFLYPKLCKLQLNMWHISSWGETRTKIVIVDILKPCPMKQLWPFCSWCNKFLFPACDHRNSKKHLSLVDWYLPVYGPNWVLDNTWQDAARWL